LGVEQNEEKTTELYQKAAKQGHKEAQGKIAVIP
jgi:TPR repeat protein